jgi:hypothetical protein
MVGLKVNERIKEIILEHGLGKLGCTSRMEMLAELIVRECVGVIESGRFLHDQAPTAIFAKECSGAVKRHFGVE